MSTITSELHPNTKSIRLGIGLFGVLTAILAVVFFFAAISESQDPTIWVIFLVVALASGCFWYTLVAINRKLPNRYLLAWVSTVLLILAFPIGTVFGIYYAVRLFQNEIKYDLGAKTSYTPPDAATLARLAVDPRTRAEALIKTGSRDITLGALFGILGALITCGSMSAASSGGTYYIYWGAVLYGVIAFFSGISKRSEGNRILKSLQAAEQSEQIQTAAGPQLPSAAQPAASFPSAPAASLSIQPPAQTNSSTSNWRKVTDDELE